MDFETRAIHEGQEPDPATGAITTPIYLTSTYVQDAVCEPKGYDFDYLPAAEFDDLSSHLDERTRIVWIETPSNPMLNIVDIKKAADAAHAAGALLVVDNTFATPYLQRPLEFGAENVLHAK